MPKRNKLLLYLVAMVLFFLLLLAIIWLVYDYRIHELDKALKSTNRNVPAVLAVSPNV